MMMNRAQYPRQRRAFGNGEGQLAGGVGRKHRAPSTVRPLARGPRVLVGWPLPLGFGVGGRLLLARRGRVYV